MIARSSRLTVVIFAGLLGLGGGARGQEQLDLSIQPEDVARPDDPAPLHDLSETGAPVPEAVRRGWSVRPEVDLDLKHDEAGDGALGTIDPELESLGVRLERTW